MRLDVERRTVERRTVEQLNVEQLNVEQLVDGRQMPGIHMNNTSTQKGGRVRARHRHMSCMTYGKIHT